MIQSDNYEGAIFPSESSQKAKIDTPNFNPENSTISQNISEGEYSTNFQQYDQQKRLSWLDCSLMIANRTTASNSTEFQVQNSTIIFNTFGDKHVDQNKYDSISVQNAVFSEESSCSSRNSRTQSQDFTPFLVVLANKKSSAICQQQSDDWSQEKSSSILQNIKEEFNIDQEKLAKQQSTQSENILTEYQNQDQVINQDELVHEQKCLDPLVIEEIQKINQQENDDETQSPTLKLNRIKAQRDNSLEQRIYRWLDIHGIFQVDPSVKREEYYSSKRENLIKVRKISKPLEDGMKNSTGSLNLCKISSSPLFSRRQQVRQVPTKKKNFLEINDENEVQQQVSEDIQVQFEKQPICSEPPKSENFQFNKQTPHKLIKDLHDVSEIKNNEISIKIKEAPEENIIESILPKNSCSGLDTSQNQINLFKTEELNQISCNNNNILPKKKVRGIHELNRVQVGSDQDKEFKQNEYSVALNNESQFNQENCDFINKRPIPNLDIEKNQKRRSLKSVNSIPSLNAIGNLQ
ncbi:hypothetical protein TTHERM_00046280 (macronuclear) [Tetrahymena thermophila SB210]|uniref:Uncharacterized protein n=1 Tax=Tetrahymena thermophila (strain SB210) TaxID=312017 RepID=Q23DR3_TETTS|nr:hypothetical protein TTHERM_00046280 [Tetrahymena thermophila SB210]EAR94701.1 hypothetical protein TTHERM_00046280 [Tetrahymena thermophila SB210]|eukprot:XP_001014623.1 hypothetical protein TTHERM_00046280 [Tetrahymena thermophila SB210]